MAPFTSRASTLIAFVALLQTSLLSSCDSMSNASKIADLELRRADGNKVSLSLWAAPSAWWKFTSTPTYYIEFNGQKEAFAGGGFESTYANVVQSADKDRAVVLMAFRGAARGVIELDLHGQTVRKVDGHWLKDYQREGWEPDKGTSLFV